MENSQVLVSRLPTMPKGNRDLHTAANYIKVDRGPHPKSLSPRSGYLPSSFLFHMWSLVAYILSVQLSLITGCMRVYVNVISTKSICGV